MAATVVEQGRRVQMIDVNEIRESPQALRVVDRKNPEYVELAEQVRLTGGPLSAISVREMYDAETQETYYALIDGLQRWTATKDAGINKIPAQILSSDDVQVILDQIIANTSRVETKPAEYSKQLQRYMQANPTVTVYDLAAKLGKGDAWIKARLNLVNLSPDAAKLMDSGAINLNNGYSLSKLPSEDQADFLQQAQEMSSSEFGNLTVSRLDAIKAAKKAGGSADKASVFVHKPYLRKPAEITDEANSLEVASKSIAVQRLTTAEDGWQAALLWASMSDPDSVSAAKAKFDEGEALRVEKKKKAGEERDRRKLNAASIKLERAKLDMQLTESGVSDADKKAALDKFDAEVAAKAAAAEAKVTE